MGNPAKALLPIFGLAGLAAAASIPEEKPATAEPAKTEAPPTPAAPASAPQGGKPQRKQPSFLSGASLLPPPGTATQGKSLLGA